MLVTKSSSLKEVLLVEKNKLAVTIDSKGLVRLWNLLSGETIASYSLELSGSITAVALDKSTCFLAIGNELGEVKVYHVYSGGLFYDLPKAPSEITSLMFIEGISDYWLVGTCWKGSVLLYNASSENRSNVSAKRI